MPRRGSSRKKDEAGQGRVVRLRVCVSWQLERKGLAHVGERRRRQRGRGLGLCGGRKIIFKFSFLQPLIDPPFLVFAPLARPARPLPSRQFPRSNYSLSISSPLRLIARGRLEFRSVHLRLRLSRLNLPRSPFISASRDTPSRTASLRFRVFRPGGESGSRKAQARDGDESRCSTIRGN